MAKRVALSKKVRFEVFKRDKFTCQYCGRSAPDVILHVDHITPVSKGGTNDVTNLVTACSECNLGKSDVELSDDAVVKKEKAQLDEMQERREQLEMMRSWQMELTDEAISEVSIVCDIIDKLSVVGGTPNDKGKRDIRSLIRKFGFDEVCDAARTSFCQYDTSTHEGWEHAFSKIGGICYCAHHDTCYDCAWFRGKRGYSRFFDCGKHENVCGITAAETCDDFEKRAKE